MAAKATGNALTRKAGPLPVWVWMVAGLAVGFLWWRHRGASSGGGTIDMGGSPSSSRDSSAAQEPSGGGGNSAENLPDALLTSTGSPSAPDTMTQQVQAADASSSQAPTAGAWTPGVNPIGTAPGSPFNTPYVPPTYIAPPGFGGGNAPPAGNTPIWGGGAAPPWTPPAAPAPPPLPPGVNPIFYFK